VHRGETFSLTQLGAVIHSTRFAFKPMLLGVRKLTLPNLLHRHRSPTQARSVDEVSTTAR
jgi:hypothetical protein